MARSPPFDGASPARPPIASAAPGAIDPLTFSTHHQSGDGDIYLCDPSVRKLVEFFESKGLKVIKSEDRAQQWYEDWIAYQAANHLYASLLSPKEYSTLGHEFDLLRLARFLEVFGYFSPAHGYSLQVTFLGLFAILMGTNAAVKREAVAALEAGALLAFGVSEQSHGSDLLANEFSVAGDGPGRYIASGAKYYIGNANCASIIAILGRKVDRRSPERARRATPVLFALRPRQAKGFGNLRRIHTLGIRSAYVGAFDLKEHELPETDLLAEGRDAWEAVLGTVTLGKFFLGFGSIGICEHAFAEAIAHMTRRVLYSKPVVDMPHMRSMVSQAYARLSAMKLYAYRALDYVHAASADDRRYLLFNAVQKAKVSTEGVKAMSLLSECAGAWGFESDTYFEMALRDVQLFPGLEGSTHINLALTAQFIPQYFSHAKSDLAGPASLAAGACESKENPYLMQARGGSINTIAFPSYLKAYRPLWHVPNVRCFAKQARAFRRFVRGRAIPARASETQTALVIGQCLAMIAYGQLLAENCALFDVPPPMVSAMFHLLVSDLSAAAFAMASTDGLDASGRRLISRLMIVPKTAAADWDFVLARARAVGLRSSPGRPFQPAAGNEA